MSISSNLSQIEARIEQACARAGRSRSEVTLVGVSKLKPSEAITEALDTTALRDFGENYVQEYVEKRKVLSARSEAIWHLIGHLQRNKVRQLMSYPPALIHSVDSIALAQQIDRITGEMYPDYRQPILVELRIGDEDGEKTGLSPDDLPELMTILDSSKNLEWRGLMLIPPASEDPEEARPYFRRVKAIFDQINANRTEKLDILSYGMSHDFEVAIEEGATHIRVGTAIFGARS